MHKSFLNYFLGCSLFLVSIVASGATTNSEQEKTCKSLDGVYELYMGTMQLEQSGCDSPTIKRTIHTKSGGVFVTEYKLDGVKYYSEGKESSYKHEWNDNRWVQYFEVYKDDTINKMAGAHYLDEQGNLVKEDFNPKIPLRIYKRLR